MSTRTRNRATVRRAVATAAMAALATASLGVVTSGANAAIGGDHTVDSAAGVAAGNVVDPALLAELRAARTAEFFVHLHETADLSSAASIESREAKAAHVYEELTATAETSQADLRALLDERGATYTPFWITNTLLVTGDRDLVHELADRPDVSHIEAHSHLELVPTEPVQTVSQLAEWGVADIGADHAWNVFGARGQRIVVASIDTGVEFDHPALVNQYRGNLGGGMFDHNYNWFDPAGICPAGTPCDNHNHGTHVTGIMVGRDGPSNQIGVAPRAQWIAAKGCEFASCSQASLLASGQWMVAPTDLNGQNPDPSRAPHVVNNSWGGPGGNTWYEPVINAWVAAGIFPIFAAGNSGANCGSVGSPADNIPAYAVGSYDINHAIAPFSGRGPSQVDGTTIKPNITGPGVGIRSSITGHAYGTFSGTSMAAPHAAGTVALVWSAQPSLIGDVAMTRNVLDATAGSVNDLACGGVPANNNVWGQGRLDAFQAVWLARTL